MAPPGAPGVARATEEHLMGLQELIPKCDPAGQGLLLSAGSLTQVLFPKCVKTHQ